MEEEMSLFNLDHPDVQRALARLEADLHAGRLFKLPNGSIYHNGKIISSDGPIFNRSNLTYGPPMPPPIVPQPLEVISTRDKALYQARQGNDLSIVGAVICLVVLLSGNYSEFKELAGIGLLFCALVWAASQLERRWWGDKQ